MRTTSLTHGVEDFVAMPESHTGLASYDNADRLTSVINKRTGPLTLSSFTYTLDAAGNRTQMVDNSGANTYQYDALYRLTQVTYPGPQTDSYTYDAVGNRLTKNAATYTYDAADEMLTAGGVTYGYDNNGNQIARGADTFAYDHENRLTQTVIGGATSSSVYNGDGLRMSHTVSGGTTSYSWDVATGLPVVLQDGTNTYVYGLDLISATDATGVQTYFTYDGIGSTSDLTDASGNVVATYSYDVFGAIRSQTGSSGNYWQFTGEQRDANSGLYYLRARHYDAASGRFLSRDPLPGSAFLPETHTPYSYVGANPVNRLDPSGRSWVPEHGSEPGPDKEGGMGPAGGGPSASHCYYPTPDCKFDIHVDLDKIREYWDCINFGIGLVAMIAGIVAANPWVAGVTLAITVTGDIVIQSDEEGAAEGATAGTTAAIIQAEINALTKLHKPKYIPWTEVGTKGFGEWTLGAFLLGYDAWNCGKSVGFVS